MKFANSLYVVATTATGMANRIGIGIAESLTASHGVGVGVRTGVGIADLNRRFVRSAGTSACVGTGAGICVSISVSISTFGG